MLQQVRRLLDLITKSVDALEKTCSESKTELPSLDEPLQSAHSALWADPDVAEAVAVISAATLHLNALVSPPQNLIHSTVASHFKSAAIRMCLEGSVTEILREAGPEGLHVDDIAAKNGLDAQRLARCMRTMATHHIYREVKPDVFTNNRISSLLDTMKPSAEIIADPFHKYDNTYGMAAMSGHKLDEQFKASAYLWETASDPKTAKSGEPNESPFARAVGNGKTLWEWAGQPENAFNQRRFDIGMRGTRAHIANNPIIAAYDWMSLPADSLVVDVGGGVGTSSLAIAKEFPNLKFVVQDRQPVVEAAVELWNKEQPDALSSGRVQLQAQNFFAPQPQKNASIFFLKHVLHNWSDKYSLKILKQLRDAAAPDTKLVVLDMIIPYACHDDTDDIAGGITSGVPVQAPNPLLANWGAVNDQIYILDMTMLTMFNSPERTIRQFDQLFRSAGWKITAVRRGPGFDVHLFSSIIAVPI